MRDKLFLNYIWFIIISCVAPASLIADKDVSPSHPAVIAIMDVSSGESKLKDAVSLITASLSQKSSIKLVEREEINAVLKELELSANGFVKRENILHIGQLLRADGLVLLSLSDDEKILRVRLVDTRYGFRLLDTRFEWDEKKLEDIVGEIGSRLVKVAPKLIIPPEKEVLVGILSMRNTDPSSTLNWLELTLPGLISSRLSTEPNIIVLEREDLNLALEEKLFTRGEGSSFHGSMALLEGEVEQISSDDKKNHFALTLHIKQSNGESIGDFKTKGDVEKLTVLTENLASWMVKVITDLQPQGVWDIKKEAERFIKEGKVLLIHRDWNGARPLIETACALDPMNGAASLESVLEYRGGFTPLEYALNVRRRIDLLNFVFQQGKGTTGGDILIRLDSIWYYLNSKDSIETEDIKSFNKETRRSCKELSERAYLDFERNSTQWFFKIGYPIWWAGAVSETPEEAMQRVKKVLSKLLLKPEEGGYPISDTERVSLLCHHLVHYRTFHIHILNAGHLDGKKMQKLWLNFLSEIAVSDDPVMKIMGEIGFIESFRFFHGFTDRPEIYEHADKVMEILIKELNYPNEPLTPTSKRLLRSEIEHNIMVPAYAYTHSPKIWVEKVEGLIKPLVEKGDVENLLLWDFNVFFGIGYIKWESETGERILNLLDSIINRLENMDINFSEEVKQAIDDKLSQLDLQVSYLKEWRLQFLEKNSEIKVEDITSSRLNVKILCDFNNYLPKRESWMRWGVLNSKETREDKILWVSLTVSGSGLDNEVWLVGINLEDKSLHSFWRALFPSLPPFVPVTKPVVGRDVTYLGVWGIGIVKFPGTAKSGIEILKNPEVITYKDGLPSNDITGIARVGNKLYLSVCSESRTGSGFGIYDLKTKKWRTISSSRSKNRTCPLNIESPYRITSLTPLDEKKLFFICDRSGGPLDGLWKMDIDSEKIERIKMPCYAGYTLSGNIVPDEKNWWLRGDDVLIFFDPDLETCEVIVCRDFMKPHVESTITSQKTPSKKSVYVPSGFHEGEGGLFKDAFWMLAEGWGLSCIFLNQPVPKIMRYRDDILGFEEGITGLYPTPYGVVVIGKNKIGLIEENPE